MTPDLTYISLGAGVQSSALLVCSALGLHGVPRADVAIFADTCDEPEWVYTQLGILAAWAGVRGIPVQTVTAGCLSADVVAKHKGQRTRFAAIPAFTTGKKGRATPLRRQCTREYKIEPIERFAKTMLGYRKRQVVRKRARALIGISRDEAIRMKPSRTRWIDNVYPLVDAGLRRDDCRRILAEHLKVEAWRKSACRFCPFRDDASWLDMRKNHPEEFEKAAKFDDDIRDMSKSKVRGKVYLHRSLRPLRQVEFKHERQIPLLAADGFGSECEGMCGV